MKPMLNPQVDLKGAMPETLARALSRPSKAGKPVIRSKVTVEKIATDQARNRRPHLIEGS